MQTCPRCHGPNRYAGGSLCEDCFTDAQAGRAQYRAAAARPASPPAPVLAVRCLVCCQPLPTEPVRPSRVTCSRRCRRIRQVRLLKARRASRRQARPCLQCRQWFLPKDPRKKTCCDTCKANYRRQWQRDHARVYQERRQHVRQASKQPKTCGICGKSWVPADKRSMACSRDCCRELLRRRAKERYHANKGRNDIPTFAL